MRTSTLRAPLVGNARRGELTVFKPDTVREDERSWSFFRMALSLSRSGCGGMAEAVIVVDAIITQVPATRVSPARQKWEMRGDVRCFMIEFLNTLDMGPAFADCSLH